MDQALRAILLGGVGEVGKNSTLFEYDDQMLMVDAGVKFPEAELHGVDLVIPDFGYVCEAADDLKAIIVTHGHEDHIGALPFLVMQMDRSDPIPIYGTRMTLGLINTKLQRASPDGPGQADRVRAGRRHRPRPVQDRAGLRQPQRAGLGRLLDRDAGRLGVPHRRLQVRSAAGRRARHRRGGAAPPRRQGDAGAVLGLRARREPGLDRLGDDGQREPREADRRGVRAGDRHDVRLEPGPAAAGGPHRPPARPEGRGGRSQHGPEPEGRRRDRLPRRARGHDRSTCARATTSRRASLWCWRRAARASRPRS